MGIVGTLSYIRSPRRGPISGGGTPAPTPTPTPAPVFSAVKANGFRGASPSRTWAVGTTQTSFMFRRWEKINYRCDQIGLGFLNFLTNNSGEGTNGAAASIVALAIECNGVTVALPMAGIRTGTVASGSTKFETDMLSAAAFGLPFFEAGTQIWVRGRGTFAASATALTIDRDVYNGQIDGELYCQFAPGSAGEDQVDATGVMTTPAGATLTQVYVPSALLCRVEAGKKSNVIVNDSVGSGYQDFTYDGTEQSGGAFRRLQHVGGPSNFLLGAFGMTMGNWGTKQAAVLATGWFTHGIPQRGANDITGGAALATLQTRDQTITTAITAAGLTAYRLKLGFPNTSGNYLATDTVNQVKPAQFAVGGVADQFNAWVDTQVGSVYAGAIAIPAWDSANKFLVPGREFTLSVAAAANATSIVVAGPTAPLVGDTLVINPGVSTKIAFGVGMVTGTGPWTCGVSFSRYPTPNNLAAPSSVGATGFAQGTVVKASYLEASTTAQETHISPVLFGIVTDALKTVAPFA